MKTNRIAIITARGGSKRIPGKNIKAFCGKPILAYSIEAALNSGLFSEVMVSTDSIEIAEAAKSYGAQVPFFRSKQNADDYAATSDVILEVLHEYLKMNRKFHYICCIYPTAPFVTPEKLKAAMQMMEEHHPAAVCPVVAFSYPPQRCFILNQKQHLEYKYPEYIRTRSQDLEKQYHDAGQFYIYETSVYLKNQGVISKDIMPMILPELEVQDIDHETDWKLAELKYQLMLTAQKTDVLKL
ncbi:MAG: pseudaminic acid cytidylyltransferase [Eubacterium sp.]|nr:pseudaminic acid cytidylyltransferase [Eubacterium sp.]